MAASTVFHQHSRRLPPDSWATNLFLAFLTTAGIFYVPILPALVLGLQDGLSYSARTAGFVASANTYGAAVGGLLAVVSIGRVPWRAAVLVALGALILMDLGSVLIRTPELMIPLRFVHGTIGGLVVGLGYSLIARTRSPERVFGLLIAVQLGLGGIGLAVLPPLVRETGILAVFGTLALFSAVTLLMTIFLPDPPPARTQADGHLAQQPQLGHRTAFVAALSGTFLFQAGTMGLTVYIFGLGRSFGISSASVGIISGLSSWLAVIGAGLVVALGTRHGRAAPLVTALAAALICRFALYWSEQYWVFVVGCCFAFATHAFVLPYLLGLCAAFDKSGRSAALGGLFSKLGLATGPAVAAVLLDEQHFMRLIAMSLVGIALSGIAAGCAARYLDRGRSMNETEAYR